MRTSGNPQLARPEHHPLEGSNQMNMSRLNVNTRRLTSAILLFPAMALLLPPPGKRGDAPARAILWSAGLLGIEGATSLASPAVYYGGLPTICQRC